MISFISIFVPNGLINSTRSFPTHPNPIIPIVNDDRPSPPFLSQTPFLISKEDFEIFDRKSITISKMTQYLLLV